MTEIILSQSEDDWLPEDDDLPPVDPLAGMEALRIINEILAPRMKVYGDTIVMADAARHKLALALVDVWERGLPYNFDVEEISDAAE